MKVKRAPRSIELASQKLEAALKAEIRSAFTGGRLKTIIDLLGHFIEAHPKLVASLRLELEIGDRSGRLKKLRTTSIADFHALMQTEYWKDKDFNAGMHGLSREQQRARLNKALKTRSFPRRPHVALGLTP